MALIFTNNSYIDGNKDGHCIHLEYSNYNGTNINQADAILLYYPLQYFTNIKNENDNFFIKSYLFNNSINICKNDLLYYESRTSTSNTAQFFTCDSSYSIAWLKLAENYQYLNSNDNNILM